MVTVTTSSGADWASVGALVFQFLAFLAAVLAYLELRKQISQVERHHRGDGALAREQFQAALRPLIMITAVQLEQWQGGTYTAVTVENIGPGPALNVVLRAWPRRLSRQGMPAWEAQPLMDQAEKEVNLDDPEMGLRLGPLGAGAQRREPLAIYQPALETERARLDFLVYFATYRDVFGNEFPRQPREKWEAGHLMVTRSEEAR